MDYLSLKTCSWCQSPVAPRVQVMRAGYSPRTEPQVSTYRKYFYLVKSKALFGGGGLSSCKSQLQIPLPTLPIPGGGGRSRCPNALGHPDFSPTLPDGRSRAGEVFLPVAPCSSSTRGRCCSRPKKLTPCSRGCVPIQRLSYGRRGCTGPILLWHRSWEPVGAKWRALGYRRWWTQCREECGHSCRRLLPPPQVSPGHG